MVPQSKEEWVVIIELMRLIRRASADERKEMLDLLQGTLEHRNTRFYSYRSIIETWVTWWNNTGRMHYSGNIQPPMRATTQALACEICQGIYTIHGGYCEICGRDVSLRDFGA
jgi:hypothetical protein